MRDDARGVEEELHHRVGVVVRERGGLAGRAVSRRRGVGRFGARAFHARCGGVDEDAHFAPVQLVEERVVDRFAHVLAVRVGEEAYAVGAFGEGGRELGEGFLNRGERERGEVAEFGGMATLQGGGFGVDLTGEVGGFGVFVGLEVDAWGADADD